MKFNSIRAAEAVQYLVWGMAPARIVEKMKFRDERELQAHVKEHLRRVRGRPTEEIRKIELQRTDALLLDLRAIMSSALKSGDLELTLKASDRLIKLMEFRAKILGLVNSVSIELPNAPTNFALLLQSFNGSGNGHVEKTNIIDARLAAGSPDEAAGDAGKFRTGNGSGDDYQSPADGTSPNRGDGETPGN